VHLRLVALIAAVVTALIVGSAGVAADRSTPLSSDGAVPEAAARGAVPKTRITLRAHTCPRCPVRLTDGNSWWTNTHRVRAGHVSFQIPTRHTHGLVFEVSPRWANAGNASTVIVTRYANTPPGERIGNEVARHKRRGTSCWAGTSARHVVMTFRAVKFRAQTPAGDPGHALRAWFNPLRRSTPPMERTWRGSVGHNGLFECRT